MGTSNGAARNSAAEAGRPAKQPSTHPPTHQPAHPPTLALLSAALPLPFAGAGLALAGAACKHAGTQSRTGLGQQAHKMAGCSAPYPLAL